MEKISKCLICGNTEFSLLFSCTDFVATGESFEISCCKECSFLFTNPRPSVNEIERYYQSNKYISHSKDKRGLMYKIYDIVRNYSIKKKIALIKNFHPNGELMDLGCGLGDFLNGVHKDGTFNATGVDVSIDAIKYVKEHFGLAVQHEKNLDQFDENSFDIITQWHVLEHVHFLNERIVQLKRLLKLNGTLFIAVPNSNSWDAKHYKMFWDAYDVPRHLYHFNQKTFHLLMKKHGLKIIETHPLVFDSPYISMRSEQHQNKSFSFIRGCFFGLISTIMAQQNRDHSSLLYIVKHA